LYDAKYSLFKTVFPSWDNTARRVFQSNVLKNTPSLYKKWLKDCIEWTKENKHQEEQFVFINAWNEWAEGAHLEPDQKYGYAYLQATKEALEETV
jgi:lipopolysaccharide biosynthesis protein